MTSSTAQRNPDRDWRLAIVIIAYLISLALPGLHLIGGDFVEGWRLLLTGWYGFLILEFAWLANILFLLGVASRLLKADTAAGVAGIAAFAIGLLSLRSTHWIAHHERISHLGWGFYVWMAAFLVLASYLFDGLRKMRRVKNQDATGG